MAQINSYKIVDDPKSNDRLLTYRASTGETVQIPLSTLGQFLPSTLIGLEDTPGTYIGQQGKTLAVNNTEDGTEFVPNNLSPNFITLPDTPAGYSGNADKVLRVNLAENAVDFVDDTFLSATDTPATYAGEATNLVTVNAGETDLEFVSREDITPGTIYVTQASDLAGTLDSTKVYVIVGTVDMGNQSVEVPATGLNLVGYSFAVSKLVSAFAGYTMFTSPVGGSGDVLGRDYAIEVTGAGSQVYDLTDATGLNAFEFARINYNNCTSLGTIADYRQGLESGTGRFGGTPELTLAGTWLGGYFIDTSIVRFLTDGAYSLFKAGAGFTMASRFRSNQNIDLNATVNFFDFAPANFISASTVQLDGCIVTRNGVLDSSDATLIPNMAPGDLEASWSNNNGLPNTFEGGELNVTAEVTTTITVAGTFVDLDGVWTSNDLQHFDEPANGQLRHIGESPVEYKVGGQLVLDANANDEVDIKIVVWRSASSTFVDGKTQRRVIDNLQGGRDVGYFALSDNITLNENDYVKLQVANVGATNNITAEVDSFFIVEAR